MEKRDGEEGWSRGMEQRDGGRERLAKQSKNIQHVFFFSPHRAGLACAAGAAAPPPSRAAPAQSPPCLQECWFACWPCGGGDDWMIAGGQRNERAERAVCVGDEWEWEGGLRAWEEEGSSDGSTDSA